MNQTNLESQTADQTVRISDFLQSLNQMMAVQVPVQNAIDPNEKRHESLRKWSIRLTIYSFFGGHFVLCKLALLSKRERAMIQDSKIIGSKKLSLPVYCIVDSKYNSRDDSCVIFNPLLSLPNDHYFYKAIDILQISIVLIDYDTMASEKADTLIGKSYE